ncbi:hypothetical protein MTX78_04180 [Hymenobacter tibetensis]|uniref:Glycosyltransferase n=1 Tax=Hymenobacter tibetensis TaxID=497967 RepID=A0ABY4CZU5_9BACT|nr:hypothetical protein [Hymenobacter tibetensis]UOG75798.1 hypothetical protein MTX78_04180 [Hymenobacter tibetensis]
MKIVFVCGSLEPGRDGVGDYTRRLAAKLISQGHQVAAVALNDGYSKEEFLGSQDAESQELHVLRIPASYSSATRFARAQQWIDTVNPEWLSLQYVPFAFHKKGLPWGLDSSLERMGRGRHWHIMFHELWVGMDTEAPLKYVLMGRVQKYLINALLKKLRPAAIHTQTKLYQALLEKLGYKTHYLPLFGNIPVVSKASSPTQALHHAREQRDVALLVFGTLHPKSYFEEFTKEASQLAKAKGIRFSLTAVGRCGSGLDTFSKEWKGEGLPLNILGEQAEEEISQALSSATIGLSTTVLPLAEKSGTVAAMREHGLPVLCIAKPWEPCGISNLALPPGIVQYQQGQLEAYLSNAQPPVDASNVLEVSQLMVADLTASVPASSARVSTP